MQRLTIDDIQNLHEYELARLDFRSRVIDAKARRRIPLGPMMTLVFENRDTVRWQVQEMMRVEQIVREKDIQHELDTYNDLLGKQGELLTVPIGYWRNFLQPQGQAKVANQQILE